MKQAGKQQKGKTQNKKMQEEKKWETMTAWQINREGFAFFHRLCPNFMLAQLVRYIFAGLSPYFNIYMTAEIVGRLSKGAGRAIYPVIVFTVIGNFAIGILRWILGEVCGIKNRAFTEELDRQLTAKVQSMDYQDIEDPEVQQLRRKISEDSRMNGRGTGMFITSISEIAYGLSSVLTAVGFFVELVIILLFAKPLVGIAFLVGLCVLLALNIIASMKYQEKESKLAEKNGKTLAEENRMEDALDCSHSGKDIRIYRQERLILPLKRRYLIDIHWEMFSTFFKRVFCYETLPVALKYLLDLFIYAIVCIYALLGVIGVGSIIKYIGFVESMTDSLIWLIRNITALKFNTPFLAQFLRFFYYPSAMHDGTLPVEEGCHEIEFCNVSFCYPGSNAYALRNVSLRIREGERTAIVGRNGSGKTTLIKLLCRLYDPTEGVIRLDGKDIREYQYDEYIRLFSAVFQDYKLFAFSILENIASSGEPDRQRAAECLELAGFGERLSEMPKGLDTALYKDFEEDGVEVSGGEAQKIAVARAIYQDAAFVLLDEPTAALDPISEHELYQKFGEISKGKTVVYISHRLSSCCFCNRILVLKGGKLVSDGPHERLLKESEEYRGLWNAQAQYYAG